jgi:hypothetical protein
MLRLMELSESVLQVSLCIDMVYKAFCLREELYLCLDLILGRRIWCSMRRSHFLGRVGSVDLCTGATDYKNIRD